MKAQLHLRYRCGCLILVGDQRRVHEMLDAALAGPCPACKGKEVVEVVHELAAGVVRCVGCGKAAAGYFRDQAALPWCMATECAAAIRQKARTA